MGFNDHERTHLDLFSGIGGFALAAKACGVRTIAFCEVDKFCCRLLAKQFPGVPNVGDITCADWRPFARPWLLTGGFPCQPFSVAGKRRGKDDDRALWPAMLRVIAETRPCWVLGENVPGIIGMELDNVLSDLGGIGYATGAVVIPAVAVDARHRRDRVWIVAHAECLQGWQSAGDTETVQGAFCAPEWAESASRIGSGGENMANADESRLQGRNGNELSECKTKWIAGSSGPSGSDASEGGSEGTGAAQERRGLAEPCWWIPEPDVGRVANGIPARVDRLRGLGNAIVPQVAAEIIRAMIATEDIEPCTSPK